MGPIIHDPSLYGRSGIFRDRDDAGESCAGLLQAHPELVSDALCGAVPSGGVAIAGPIARRLGLPLTLLIARKVQVPGNTEFGMGAVAWDGRVILDRPLISALSLGPREVDEAVRRARASVEERIVRFFFGDRRMPDVRGRRVLVVDDGLAGGSTALVVVAALRSAGAGAIVVTVPTGHDRTVALVAEEADAVVCANIRSGDRFAVAEAYRRWRDLDEQEVLALLRELGDEGIF